MTKRLSHLFATATSVVVVMIGCVQATDDNAMMTKEEITSLIERELPLGTSRETVIAFLDKRKIEHSGDATEAPANVIYAMFRDVKGSTLTVKKSIQVVFRFKDNKLDGYSIAEKLTGP